MTETFKYRAIQDLAWVINSPPLITECPAAAIAETTKATPATHSLHWLNNSDCQREFQHCLPALQQLDNDPSDLHTHLQQLKSQRLGIRFEALVAYWFTLSPHYEVLYQNHPLRHAGRTLGEMDFILRDIATDKIIHLEVAVKFYLGKSANDTHGNDDQNLSLNHMNQWHGPNLHDRLDIKYNHLINHQTQLSLLYPDLMPCPIDERWCLLKGRLFYPKSHINRQTTFSHSGHLTGYWQQIARDHATTAQQAHYKPLKKEDWLAPLDPSQTTERLDVLPSQLERATCFAYCPDTTEQDRLFLLPQHFWEAV